MTLMLAGAVSAGAVAQELTGSELAVRNINRAMDLVDASWEKTIIGGDDKPARGRECDRNSECL